MKKTSKYTSGTSNRAMSAPRDRMLEVRPGRTLFWPDGNPRGEGGYTVREDDPFIGKAGSNLRPVSDPDREADPVTDPKWRGKALSEGYEKFGTELRPVAPPAPEPIEHQPEPDAIPEPDA